MNAELAVPGWIQDLRGSSSLEEIWAGIGPFIAFLMSSLLI